MSAENTMVTSVSAGLNSIFVLESVDTALVNRQIRKAALGAHPIPSLQVLVQIRGGHVLAQIGKCAYNVECGYNNITVFFGAGKLRSISTVCCEF
jgi:hypothetical protein